MAQRIMNKDFATRAVRIVLVFALVFWSSFRVECLAFADPYTLDDLSSHSEESLNNVIVYRVMGDGATDHEVSSVLDSSQKEPLYVNPRQADSIQFVASAFWGPETKDAAVKAVEDLINALPSPDAMTADDLAAVDEAITAYNALSDEQRGKLPADLASKLDAASAAADALRQGVADQEAAQAAEAAIAALPDPGSATVDTRDALDAAQAQYDSLTDAQRALVSGDAVAKLQAVSEAVAQAEAEAAAAAAEPDPEPEPEPEPEPSEPVEEPGEGGGGGNSGVVQQASAIPSSLMRIMSVERAYAAEGDAAQVGSISTQSLGNPIADYVDWKLYDASGNELDPSIATISAEGGIATLVGKTPGTVVVRCTPREGVSDGAQDLYVEFTVKVVYVSSIEICDAGGNRLDAENSQDHPFALSEDERKGFELSAVANAATGPDDGDPARFTSTAASPLSQSSDGLLHDLTWNVFDTKTGKEATPDVASITPEGVLSVADEKALVEVRCTTSDDRDGEYSYSLFVSGGKVEDKPEDVQGESHPQDELTVIVQRPKAQAPQESEGQENSGEAADPESQEGSGEAASPEGGESVVDTQAEGDGSSDAAAKSDGAASSEFEETTSHYTAGLSNVETGKQLDVNEKTYSMTLDGKARTVSGRGTTLGLLLDDAGVTLDDQQNIESIEFVNFFQAHTTVPWSDFVSVTHSEATYLMVASQAYVHQPESSEASSGSAVAPMAEGDEAADQTGGESGDQAGSEPSGQAGGEPGEGDLTLDEGGSDPAASASSEAADPSGSSASADKFLDNTRFQILFDQPDGGGSIDASNLRWVNTIIVHMKGAEPVDYVDGLRPTIDYSAVPKGKTAYLTAVPPKAIGVINFGYKWERSTDGGKKWSDVAGTTQQTIYVPTDDEHIGNLYRVSVITDDGLSEPSDPVEIREGSEFSVQLDFVPPLAGGWANFTAHVIGADENDPSIVYRWEYSTDGGQNWQVIEGETGKTLVRQTYPISETPSTEDGESGEAEEPELTYIHVIAIKDTQSAVSNRQLLTVRTGDSNGSDTEEKDGNKTSEDPKADEVQNALNGDDSKKDDAKKGDAKESAETEEEVETDDELDYDPDVENDTNYEEVDEIEFVPAPEEEQQPSVSVTPLDVTYDDSSTQPSEEGQQQPQQESSDLSNVTVDKNVTERIQKQKQQEKQQKESTPGARWTEISASMPNSDDVRRVLAGNPFAPFAAPFALGLTAAGAVEKLVAFRRQLK